MLFSVSMYKLIWDILGRDHVVSSARNSARVTLLYLCRHVECWLYSRGDGSRSTAILRSIGESSITSHHSVRHKALVAVNDLHYTLRFILSKFFSLMGLPSEDEWPVESPIGREAFENCPRPVITLDRLVRFQDSCAFELLRVSLFRHSFSSKHHCIWLGHAFVQAKSSSISFLRTRTSLLSTSGSWPVHSDMVSSRHWRSGCGGAYARCVYRWSSDQWPRRSEDRECSVQKLPDRYRRVLPSVVVVARRWSPHADHR